MGMGAEDGVRDGVKDERGSGIAKQGRSQESEKKRPERKTNPR